MADVQEVYARGLRAAFRALWSGVVDYSQFYDMMMTTIERGLTLAWNEGAAECGILPGELTPQERAEMMTRIVGEFNSIDSAATFIEGNTKEMGGKLGTVLKRVDLWALRVQDVRSQAKVLACANQKLMWELGATEEHCRTCAKLDKKVKRASYWERIGVRPQNPPNPLLECEGWRCDCGLNVTDAPLSRGPLGNLP